MNVDSRSTIEEIKAEIRRNQDYTQSLTEYIRHFNLGNYSLALAYIEQAIEICPNVDHLNQLGETRQRTKQLIPRPSLRDRWRQLLHRRRVKT
jgi:hypothetical protein